MNTENEHIDKLGTGDNYVIEDAKKGIADVIATDSAKDQEEKPVITKRSVFKGMLWSALGTYSTQVITFLVSIVMARLLSPSEYGIIAIIGVFLGFSQIFIDSGLGTALIRKVDAKPIDFYTVNIVNIGVSSFLYGVLFLLAPTVADFYDMPVLVPAIRVMALNMIIGSVGSVGWTIIKKRLLFKKAAVIGLSTNIITGIVGILMAYNGFGVWALVFQSMGSTAFSTIWVMIISGFRPRLKFSVTSFKNLFGFSSNVLLSNVLWSMTSNIYQLLIGKLFTPKALGYYGRANSYSSLIPNNIGGILDKVLFPVFSHIQNDEDRLRKYYNKSVLILAFYIIGGNFILIGISYPLVINMISEKWVPCVPILQILCLASFLGPINSISGRLFLAKGYSGIFLKMQLINKPVTFILFFLFCRWGIIGIAWSQVLIMFVDTFVCYYFIKKKLSFIMIKETMLPMIKIIIVSAVIGGAGLILFEKVLMPDIVNLLVVLMAMCVSYLCGAKLFFPDIMHDALHVYKK